MRGRSLSEELHAEPHRFELVQAISLLERMNRGSVPLGLGVDPDQESIRIEQDPTLAFSASDVTGLRTGTDGKTVLRTPAIGLAGLIGPLPYAHTEVLIERIARRDRSMAAFLDLFNHRILSVLYRIRRSTLPLLDVHPENTVIGKALRSFMGIGMASLSSRLPDVPDRLLLGFAGVLADRRGSAAALATVLSGCFDLKAAVHGFEGRWLDLPPAARTMIGKHGPEEARTLGAGVVLGGRAWDQHAAFAVLMRFRSLGAFEDMLPSGRHHRALLSLCRFHAGQVMDVVLQFDLDAGAVPPLKLSAKSGAKLGWTSWLLGKTGAAKADGKVRLTAVEMGAE